MSARAARKKPAADYLDVMISFTTTADEAQAIKDAAYEDRRSVSSWLRTAVAEKLRRARGKR